MSPSSYPLPILAPESIEYAAPHFHAFISRDLDRIPQLDKLPAEHRLAMKVISQVLPFRVNNYVIDELIDWSQVPEDPIFQLTFPQPGMLEPIHFEQVLAAMRGGCKDELDKIVSIIRRTLNPHPAGQIEHNIPRLASGEILNGVQHKYRETVLFFPSRGQTCHSYCSFCFRWPQFIGDKRLRIATDEIDHLLTYLRGHPLVTDLLITGGDPMVMKAAHLAEYLEPLLQPAYDHIRTIRIGTKSLSFWPHRYLDEPDSDAVLRLFERLVAAGKHVALMAHVNHWREIETPVCATAVSRIRSTGVQIRSQAPLLRHINDSPDVWARLWRTQVRLGIMPYYMFIERDTGANRYFKVPLVRTWEIYREAIQQLSGLARTARGPSMSAGPGKVEIQGVCEIAGEKVFVLRFLQARNPDWVHRPFFAHYDPEATWLNELKPAFGAAEFFFESEYRARWP